MFQARAKLTIKKMSESAAKKSKTSKKEEVHFHRSINASFYFRSERMKTLRKFVTVGFFCDLMSCIYQGGQSQERQERQERQEKPQQRQEERRERQGSCKA